MATLAMKPGSLTDAAAALEADLRAFEDAVGDTAKVRLDTRKNLERSARELQRAADLYERMQARVGALGARLQEGTDRAMGKAVTLHKLGQELKARQEEYVAMLATHEALMQEAMALRALVEQGPDALPEVQAGLAAIAERAKEMAIAAREAGFRDLAEDATGRFQQLTALSNKLGGVPS
jgi:chromosome segregation ATPase